MSATRSAPQFPAPHNLEAFRARLLDLPVADAAAVAEARARDAVLTKPPGALGRLEALVLWLAGWQGRAVPVLDQPQVVVFAGNHGIAVQGISAFPPEVTAQMVANFKAGGAAVNQLAQTYGARMSVVALDLDRPTADFTQGPAMTEADLLQALQAGWQAVDPAADLFIPGEMGIGNTTVAAALATALYGGTGWAGRGTGIDDAGLARKEAAVAAALVQHAGQLDDPLEILRRLGGREVAAMAGAILAARHHRIPVLLDGFIATAAAAVLARANPAALDHVTAAHQSDEGAHGRLLAALGLRPLLALDLRLGEASGATLALGIVKGAVACHAGMASFAEAGVSAG